MSEPTYNAQNIEDIIEGKQSKCFGKRIITVCLALVVLFGSAYAAYSYGRNYEHDKAYDEGYSEGILEGRKAGYENGLSVGRSEGYTDGYNMGYDDAISNTADESQFDVDLWRAKNGIPSQLDIIREKYGIQP